MKQQQALGILKTGANVFLTGEPGSGKTYTVNQYVLWLKEQGISCAVTASTGIAATHINGRTIHSWSGIGVSSTLTTSDITKIASNARTAKRIREVRVLVIDEISMLSSDTLAMVETVCRRLKKSDAPFGGLQVVLVGDFFQLPPVVKEYPQESRQSSLLATQGPRSVFAFSSSAWAALNPAVCYLSEQHRQEDPAFLDMLLAVRRGTVTAQHQALLRSRTADTPRTGMTQLFSHNVDVDRINDLELAKLASVTREFSMTKAGTPVVADQLQRGCLSPELLSLKVGCRVMFTKNDPSLRYVNGTLGTVVGFANETGYPIIKTHTNRIVTAEPAEWSIEDGGGVIGRITQIPLRLAWALTVHKSQGMSLDAAHMDLSRVFEYGQGYVALSRVRTLAGVFLAGINDRALRVHPEISEKDKEFRSTSDTAFAAYALLSPEELESRWNDFIVRCGGKTPSKKNSEISPKKPKVYSVDTMREKYANAYRSWSKEEDAEVLERYHAGAPVSDIANVFGRKPGAIRSRLKKLLETED